MSFGNDDWRLSDDDWNSPTRSSRFTDGKIVPENLRIHLPKGMKTIPELMREAGYFTFNCGKDDYNFHYNRHDLYQVGTDPKYKVGMNGWQGNKDPNFRDWTKSTWRAQTDKDQPWFGQIMIWGGKANTRHVRKGHQLKPNDVPIPPYFPDHPEHRKAWTMHYNAARGADHRLEQVLELLKADGELENTIIFSSQTMETISRCVTNNSATKAEFTFL